MEIDSDSEVRATPPVPLFAPSNVIDLDGTEINQEESSGPTTKKQKALTSEVWKHFLKVGVIDGKEKCKCKGCGKLLSCAAINGISHLSRHVNSCKLIPKFHDVGDMILDAEGRLRKKKFDPKVNREILVEMMITHGLPFNFVEYRIFRKYKKNLNDECTFVTRNTSSSDVMKSYEDEKRKLKSQLTQIRGRGCLTSDCWTACTNEGYISLTAHYIDVNWKLQNKILAFAHMTPPHTGRELALKVLEMLSDWGIEKNIFSITLDNASANDSMQRFLKEHLGLSNSLLFKGKFFHIRCCAHILNLIGQDGLKVVGDALHKIRQSVAYVRVTESRTLQFHECVSNVGEIDTTIGLRSDCVTRWNSTFIMLKSAINYRRAFYSLSLRDSNFKCCPSSEEWARSEIMCELLKPFYNITNLISGSSYPTSNLYFGEIWKIKCLLNSYLTSEDSLIQDMATKMRETFDKYWSECNVILAFGAILDPTKKFNFLNFAYKKIDDTTSEDKCKKIKGELYELYAEYVKHGISTPNFSQVRPFFGGGNESLASSLYICEEFEEHESQVSNNTGKSELDSYLDEQRLPPSVGFDILAYWREKSRRSPNLARMACDILSIPITAVASESAFSIGSRVLNKYRSSMKEESVQALMCTRSWLYGFEEFDNDINSNQDGLSGQASNTFKHVNVVEENSSDVASRVRTI